MTATISPAPVRRSVRVNTSPDRAFEIFTAGIGRWWPKNHSIGTAPMRETVIEPRAGGRWYETGEDGSRCEWGRVLVWEPPSRLVLSWQIDMRWQFDPALVTEVEVRFIADGGGTRVELEHRHLERFGADAEKARETFEHPEGWGGLLDLFKAAAA